MLVHKGGTGLQGSTLVNMFSTVLELDPKGTFSTSLKPATVHKSQEGLQFFYLKETNISLLVFLLTSQTYKVTSRGMFSRIFLLRQSKPSGLADIHVKSMIKWCSCLLFWELSWVLYVLFLPQLWYSIDYSISSLINIVLYYSHLCKLACPKWAIQLNEAIFKELLHKRVILKFPGFQTLKLEYWKLEWFLLERTNILFLLYLWTNKDWKCCPGNGSGRSKTKAWKVPWDISESVFPVQSKTLRSQIQKTTILR